MSLLAQVGIVIFSGIFSWTIAGWVTVNVMKYQMTQFAGDLKDLKDWRAEFEQRYGKHCIESAVEFERIKARLPGSQIGD